MTSSIDDTKPTASTALTADVRSNFSHAEDEINSLLHMSEDSVTCTGTADAMTASFSIQPVLADTPRILVTAPASTSTVTTPSITVNDTLSSGAKTIVNKDGSALVVGDITSGIFMDLVYDGTNWVWMNGNDLQAALDTVEADVATLQAVANYPPGHIDGMAFTITTDVSANDSFQVAVGTARTTTYDIDLTSALDKDITETWAEGDGNGGVNDTLFGSMAAETKYYVFAITQSDGSVDFVLDDNISGTGVLGDAAVTAAGYTELIHVGYARTGSSATALRDVWRKDAENSNKRLVDKFTLSSDATADFFNGLPSGRFTVELDEVTPATDNVNLVFRVGTASIDSGANYDYQNTIGRTVIAFHTDGAATGCQIGHTAAISNTASEGGISGDIHVDSFSSAKYTNFAYAGGFFSASTSIAHSITHKSYHKSAVAQTKLQFSFTSGNLASGVIKVYDLS